MFAYFGESDFGSLIFFVRGLFFTRSRYFRSAIKDLMGFKTFGFFRADQDETTHVRRMVAFLPYSLLFDSCGASLAISRPVRGCDRSANNFGIAAVYFLAIFVA